MRLTMSQYRLDPDYCDAKLPNGDAVTGWVLRRDGEPVYFQIEGGGGACWPYEKMAEVAPVKG